MRVRARIGGLLALAAGALVLGAPATAAGAPLITESWVSEVRASSAEANAVINPGGVATTARTEYITEAAYRANLAAARPGFTGASSVPVAGIGIGAGNAPQPYKQRLTNLKAATAYRFRVVAANTETTIGPERPFLTDLPVPAPVPPDGRGWEMVSPAEKNGGAVEGPERTFGGGVFQAAAAGGAVTYSSSSSFAGAVGAPGASQYLAHRLPGGWATENLTVELLSGSYPSEPDSGVPYQLFSTDLSRALLSNGKRCRGAGSDCPVANPPLPGSGAPAGFRNYYLRERGGFGALLGAANLAGQTPAGFEVAFAAASADLGQVVLSSCAALTAAATEVAGPGGGCDPEAINLYRRSAGGLVLVNLLPGESQGTPGAVLAAPSGAVSEDGDRVYWVDRASGNLYLREGAQTAQVDASVGGGGEFQTAGPNGAVAFFTKAGHLYRFDAPARAVTDLTPGGEVEGVLGASPDGAYLYYATTAGLFVRHGAVVAPIAAAIAPGNYPPATGSARLSADGTRLAFLSSAALTDYDNNGTQQAYLYDARTGSLTCASCNPSGERPLGPASVPGAVANGAAHRSYKPRALSADGRRLYFDSADSLVPQDTNDKPDVYQWEAAGTGGCTTTGGCVDLISSGRAAGGASFVDASADGADVFFVTDGSLVPGDFGAVDLYDARVGGGFPTPPSVIPCLGDACQPIPGEPEDPTPGTLAPGRGNPALGFPGERKPARKHGKKGKARKKAKGKKKGAKGGPAQRKAARR